MKNNLVLAADAYTVSSNLFVSAKARERSIYNLTNRYSPAKVIPSLCKDSRMVFYGLHYFINKWLIDPITHEDVSEAKYFMKEAHSFGGPLAFDEDLWRRVVDEYRGYLPIKIEAIEEGTTFFPNQPYVQVTSEEGFGEIAAHIEALMLGYVSNASARLTLCRHWYERFCDYYRAEGVAEEKLHDYAKWAIHDFGMRASSCGEESELYGLTHLLVFNGTDTFNAARLAKRMGAEADTGTSIHALAHRIVQGHNTENSAFWMIDKVTQNICKVNIASYVSDCYNFDKALDVLTQMARENPDNIYVCRPDSGDYVETVLQVCRKNLPNLRFIQGDGMNPSKVDKVVEAMHKEGFKLHEKGIFGVGGWLRNTPTRDLFSSAYKLSAKGNDLEPVCKLSETMTKMSVPGPNSLMCNSVLKPEKACPTVYIGDYTVFPNAYRTYYHNSKHNGIHFKTENKFSRTKKIVMENFSSLNDFAKANPDYGLGEEVFCDTITDIRKSTYKQYKG